MCRIAGFWDRGPSREDLDSTIVAMRDSMVYGGPDDAGVFVDREQGVGLGHRRLAILDLSPLGHQPMCDDQREIWITFNGEVYNFQDVRTELQARGHSFRSNSDTEVIVKAYREWGLDAVQKFRGMFAFAIWDSRSREMILCRDRVGVKPLYWYQQDGLFLFSSELKAFSAHPRFLKNLDVRALSTFLSRGYIPGDHCIFQNAHKLPPGCSLRIGESGAIEIVRYWSANQAFERGVALQRSGHWTARSEDDVADELEHILRESFRYRMISDVPVGVFLSGGIDSSTLAALLTREGFHLNTFTIGFNEEGYSEADNARRIADYLGCSHTELTCTPGEAFSIIEKLPAMYDEPFGDDSAIPTHLVSALARRAVTVSLSADGGDELFCGYESYRTLEKRIRRMRHRTVLPIAGRVLDLISPDIAFTLYRAAKPILPDLPDFRHRYLNIRRRLRATTVHELNSLTRCYYLDEELDEHGLPEGYQLNGSIPGLDPMNSLMLTDINSYLPDDILVKVDRASMAVALESREPFLDHHIIEFAASLPLSLKFRQGISKYILRKVTYRHVPRELLDRPKQGFGVPIETWFKDELRGLLQHYLAEDRLKKEGLFNATAVTRLLRDYLGNRGVGINRLWFLLMYEMWAEQWLHS